MRRTLVILAALLLAIPMVAFCAGQEEVADEDSPATIRFSWWGGDSRHEGTLNAIDVYTDGHPNVTIEPEYGGWQGYYEKLVTQIAGGTAADVMQVTSRWVQPLYDRDAFYVWNGADADYDRSTMEESFLRSFCIVDGDLVGFPTGMYADVMVYNKKIADSMGWELSEPWTWEEYYENCRELKEAYPDTYGLANKVESLAIQPVYAQMAQWAGHTDLATDDYEVGFSADVVERSLSYWKRFTDAGLLAPLSEAQMYSGNAQDMPMWLDGKVFSITIPSSVISKFRETENLEIGVAPLPVTEGATETGINNGPPQVFTVSKNSEYPNAAIEFIDWMINSEEAALQLTTVRGLPASSVSRQVLVGEGLVDPLTASAMDVAGPYLGSKRNAISQDAEIQDTVMEMVLEGVLRGTLAPADGAAEWVSSLEALLDEKQAAVAAE